MKKDSCDLPPTFFKRFCERILRQKYCVEKVIIAALCLDSLTFSDFLQVRQWICKQRACMPSCWKNDVDDCRFAETFQNLSFFIMNHSATDNLSTSKESTSSSSLSSSYADIDGEDYEELTVGSSSCCSSRFELNASEIRDISLLASAQKEKMKSAVQCKENAASSDDHSNSSSGYSSYLSSSFSSSNSVSVREKDDNSHWSLENDDGTEEDCSERTKSGNSGSKDYCLCVTPQRRISTLTLGTLNDSLREELSRWLS